MQLFDSEPLVEGRYYTALLCDKTLGVWQALKPLGKSYLSFHQGNTVVPPDFFLWWTSNSTKIPQLEARYAAEMEKLEEILAARRKSRA